MTTTTDARSDATYDAFWLNYLRAHSHSLTRRIHYAAITIIHIGIIAAIVYEEWLFAAAGVAVGYVTAWAAHYTVQGNDPVMFTSVKSAAWSLISGLRMYYLWLFMRLTPELRRAGIKAG